MNLATDWFRGLNPEDKEKLTKRLLAQKELFTILYNILDKRLQEKDSKELSPDAYDSPSWAYREADIIGAKRELRFLLQLLQPIVPDQGRKTFNDR